MTVKELINALQKVDEDSEVYMCIPQKFIA